RVRARTDAGCRRHVRVQAIRHTRRAAAILPLAAPLRSRQAPFAELWSAAPRRAPPIGLDFRSRNRGLSQTRLTVDHTLTYMHLHILEMQLDVNRKPPPCFD